MKHRSIAMGIFATLFLLMLSIHSTSGQVANAPGTPGTGTSGDTGVNDGRGGFVPGLPRQQQSNEGRFPVTPDTEPATRLNLQRGTVTTSPIPKASATITPLPTATP